MRMLMSACEVTQDAGSGAVGTTGSDDRATVGPTDALGVDDGATYRASVADLEVTDQWRGPRQKRYG